VIEVVDKMLQHQFPNSPNKVAFINKGKVIKCRCVCIRAQKYLLDGEKSNVQTRKYIRELDEVNNMLANFMGQDLAIDISSFQSNCRKMKEFLRK
jgi:hypothetical protein